MSSSFLDSFPQVFHLPVRTVRLGLISRIFSGGTPDKSRLEFWEGGSLDWIGSGAVNQFMVYTPTAHITPEAVLSSSTKLMPSGSLIIALAGQGKTKAMTAQMGIDAYGNQSLACIAEFKGHSRYLLWWLTALYREIRGLSSEDTRDGLNQAMVGQLPVPDFDFSTQASIAHFLDSETARIDQLIEKKQRLVELLVEKKSVRSSELVTRGFNAAVSVRPTGVDWLPQAPSHWRVRRMASIFREVDERGEENLPVLSVSINSGISDRELEDEDRHRIVNHIADKAAYKRIRPGDLVYNMMRAWQGAFGVATVQGLVSPAYVVARPNEDIHSPYFEPLLRTPMCIEEFRRASKGIADFRQRLYWEHFRQVRVVLPPLDEQQAIADQIRDEVVAIDRVVATIASSIDRLREFRSALITAAVTGQIDVKKWRRRGEVARHLDTVEEEVHA